MGKKYWVMKILGSKAEWIEMDGKQFYEFINSPAGENRYFMDCDSYKIEVSREEYCEWKREYSHSYYLRKFEEKVSILSFDSPVRDGGTSYIELAADPSVDIEDEVIKADDLRLLRKAVHSLADMELFLQNKLRTEHEVADSIGISQQTVSYRKSKILKKLKDSFGKQ